MREKNEEGEKKRRGKSALSIFFILALRDARKTEREKKKKKGRRKERDLKLHGL